MPAIEHQGLSIHYEEAGQGPPIVLGHSFLCDGQMWREQVPELARSHRVVNIDLRGHGRSSPVTGDFTLYDVVGEVVAVLDHLGIERAVWCGLSIGGMVGLRAALTRPDRVEGLILMDTTAGAETAWKTLKYRMMGAAARMVGMAPLAPQVLPLMFGRTTLREQPELVREWRARIVGTDLRSVLFGLEALVRRDSVVDRLRGIRVPALVLVGSEDRSLPPPLSRQIDAGLPDSRLVEVAGSGHLSALERPAEVTAAMLDFLSGR